MEQLTEAQKTSVRKSSTDRLLLLLLKTGYAEEVVLGWSRDELMAQYAELLLSRDPEQEGVFPRINPEIEKARFEHEQKMKQMELESMERLEMEKIAIEKEKVAIEQHKLQLERELKAAEIDAKQRAENDEVRLLKRYGEALALVLVSQTEEITELPSYFLGVEMQFDKLNIPEKFLARLVYKYLSPKSRTLCARSEPEVRDDCVKMRDAIFKEYGLSAKCFLEKFNKVKKGASDTYILYCSKLEGLLNQYLDAREIGKKYDDLVALLMSDRIKAELPEHCLKHVLSIESATDSSHWLLTFLYAGNGNCTKKPQHLVT